MERIVGLFAERDAGTGFLLFAFLVAGAGLVVAGLLARSKPADQRGLDVLEARR